MLPSWLSMIGLVLFETGEQWPGVQPIKPKSGAFMSVSNRFQWHVSCAVVSVAGPEDFVLTDVELIDTVLPISPGHCCVGELPHCCCAGLKFSDCSASLHLPYSGSWRSSAFTDLFLFGAVYSMGISLLCVSSGFFYEWSGKSQKEWRQTFADR